MPARKIGKHWYVDLRFNFERVRKKSPINTKGGAQAYEVNLLKRLMAGESLDAPDGASTKRSPKFSDFASQWFTTYVTTNNKPSEQRTKASTLRLYLVPTFGKLRLDEITSKSVEEFKARQLSRGLSAKTINNQLCILSKSLATAVEWELLAQAPKLKQLRSMSRIPETLSDAECARLLSDETEPVWRVMLLLALRTGLRLGELIGVRWMDLNLESGLLVVRQSIVRGVASSPKSGRARFIPIDPEMAHLLVAVARHPTSDLVFHRDNGEPFSDRICAKALDRICCRTGVRHIGWHVLRHTFATQLLEEREPIRNIQQLLGHSSVTVTERYTHALPDRLRASIDALAARQRRTAENFGPYVGSDHSKGSRDGPAMDASSQDFLAQQSKEHRE